MIRINWAQIRSLKSLLLGQGFDATSDLMVLVFHRNQADSQKIKVALSNLDKCLFELESDPHIIGIYVFDSEVQRPLFRQREIENLNSIEIVPSSGHTSIIVDFKNMMPDQRDVWVEMTLASISNFLATEVK